MAVAKGFIPPVLDPILGDYKRNIAGARDPEVLKLFATVVEKLKGNVVEEVPRIMEAVFECTLEMITKNFEDFPEHRIRFFEFLKAVNQHCFTALFNIPPEHQKLVVHAVVWAMKHTERNISDTVSESVLVQDLFDSTLSSSPLIFDSVSCSVGVGNFARTLAKCRKYPKCCSGFLPAVSSDADPRRLCRHDRSFA
jgi:hypothetical protein